LSAEALGWQDEHVFDHRRRLRNGALVSLALHGLVVASLAVSPPRAVPPLPAVLSVDLVAIPAAARAPRAPARPKAAPKPAPAPEPAAPPPPPPPKAPVQVLPEEAPRKIREVKPEPKPAAKPAPAPKPVPRPPRKQPLSYEDAMAALDDELGPDESPDLLQPRPTADAPATDSSGSPGAPRGVVVSPEILAWSEATTRLIQSKWVTPTTFRGRGLATTLELELSAGGDVLGTPRVLRSSGDPFFDDNAVRAVLKVNPLPPPPRAGVTSFVFRSEAN